MTFANSVDAAICRLCAVHTAACDVAIQIMLLFPLFNLNTGGQASHNETCSGGAAATAEVQ